MPALIGELEKVSKYKKCNNLDDLYQEFYEERRIDPTERFDLDSTIEIRETYSDPKPMERDEYYVKE